MAIGSLFSLVLFRWRDRYEHSILATRSCQTAIVMIVLYHYVFGLPGTGRAVVDVALAFLYGMLILNVSVLPNRVVNLEVRPLVHLGQISYGIYMYHMTIDYLLRTALGRMNPSGPAWVVSTVYMGTLLGATIAVAHVSYTRFETLFTRTTARTLRPEAEREANLIVGFAAP
jgi:peptidoglycan/LPS O-acetylase OafA/YrhL